MDNGIKGKENKSKFFTIEYFGVTLIITAFLLLACLTFGEKILFELGAEVKFFLLGLAGVSAYPLLIALAVSGVFLLFGIKPKKPKRYNKFLSLILACVFFICLTTTIFNLKTPSSLKEYTAFAFESGRNGTFQAISGGALFSIITYLPVKYLTYIGAICLFSFLLLTSAYFVFKPSKKGEVEVQENKNSQPSEMQVEQNANQPQPSYAQQSQQPQQPLYNQTQPSNVYGQQPTVQPSYPPNYTNQYSGQPLYPNGTLPYGLDNPNNQYVTLTREEALRILYGDNRGYAEQYNDMFMGKQPRTFEEIVNKTQTQTGGSVSEPISKEVQTPRFEYNDKTEVQNQPSYQESKTFEDEFSYEEEKEDESQNQSESIEESFDDIFEENKQVESDRISTRAFFERLNSSRTKKKSEEKELVEENLEQDNEEEVVEISQDDKQEDDDLQPFEKRMLIENTPKNYKYKAPPISLLPTIEKKTNDFEYEVFKAEVKQKILSTLSTFGVETQIAKVSCGPAVSRFDIEIPHSCPMSKVTRLQDDINLRVAARSPIRMIAPVPNTSYVGIEVENRTRETVGLKDIVSSEKFLEENKFGLTFALGKDVVGNPICLDLTKMPHLLVAGATGSGKSVFLNCMLLSLMIKYSPEELRLIIVDPKAVEFQAYKNVPHLMFGEIITQDVPLTNATLQWVCDEMNRRYDEFSKLGLKDIKSYNKKCLAEGKKPMFRILVLIDEFADIMLKDKNGVNQKICSIAQMSRAAGIHLVLAAQRPSVDIVEGPIKANLPSRIVFRVTSIHDSRTSLGETGAEKLLGSGDCLYITDGMSGVERVMGAFVSEEDTCKIASHIANTNDRYYDYNAWSKIKRSVKSQEESSTSFSGGDSSKETNQSGGLDPLWKDAMRTIYQFNKASTSLIQRKLAVGYPRASKIIDQITDMGIVSVLPSNGRLQILMTKEEFVDKFGEL